MPTIDPIQASMAGGEYSPSIYSRVDLAKYTSGLRTARNFMIHPQGGASNRCGFEYIAAAKYSGSMCVTQEFIFNQTQAYVLEFGQSYIRFYTDGAQIQSSGAAYQISTPYLLADLDSLRFEGSADVIWITHPDYQTRTLTRYGNADWVLETYAPVDGPFMPDNIDETASLTVSAVSGTGVTLTLSATTITDATIVSLLHMDGVDTSTTITDATGKVWTAFGNAQIDTAQKKFGTGSLLFDGTGDYVSTPDTAALNFGSSDFTIRMQIRMPNISTRMHLGSKYTDANNWWLFNYGNEGTNAFSFSMQVAGVSTLNFKTTYVPTVDTWFHLQLVRSVNTWFIFIDGVSQSLTLSSGSYSAAIGAFTSAYELGRNIGADAINNGWIDEYEILNVAADTTNFTPPIAAYSLTSTTTGTFQFDQTHVGALFKLRHYIEGQTVAQAFGSSTTSSSIKCFTTWRIITHGTWTGKLRVEKSTDSGVTWTVLRAFSSTNDFNVDTSGTEDIETNEVPFLVRLNMYSYTSGTCNVDLTTDPFYQEGIVQATAYVSATALTVSVLQTVGATTATIDWAEGSWSDYRGYPVVARFYQDRLCFASTPSEPQTIWMTQTGNYSSFARHSTLLDTDGITVNLPSRQVNQINGMLAFKQLLVFTSSAIWSVGPLSGSALTPTTITQSIEEYSGSADITPAVLGTEAIYNQVGGEIIRNIGYQLQIDGFTGSEANILAYHLFQGYTITKMCYQKNPNSIIWCLRSDGVLLSLTYNQEQQVVAWAHHDTNGIIESICVIPGDDSDELWASVSRLNGRYIERMTGRKQFDLTNHVFMDSYITQASSTLVVSGLTHIKNQAVSILADGAVLASQVVSASGTLTMSALYDLVYAGLPYYADLETLNVELPLKTGTLQGSKVKIGNVTFQLINSRGGYIGPNEGTIYEAFTYAELNTANLAQEGTTLGTTANFNGDIRVPLGAGYMQGGRLFYRQKDPLPISISSVIPEVTPGGLSS